MAFPADPLVERLKASPGGTDIALKEGISRELTMSQARRFSTVLTSPWAWANYPKLRVERRDEGRPGMPRAFLFADEGGDIIPTVYFFRNRAHNSEPMRENAFKRMEYPDLDALVEAGWRPHSGEELDVPFGG